MKESVFFEKLVREIHPSCQVLTENVIHCDTNASFAIKAWNLNKRAWQNQLSTCTEP